jgi:hypothetical protein
MGLSQEVIFQRRDFLRTCAKVFGLRFDGNLFVRKGFVSSNICPLIPYGLIPDAVILYPKVSLTTPPYYRVPDRFSTWLSETFFTNVVSTETYALHRSAQRNIKKAQKAGISVGPSEDIQLFFEIFKAMWDAQGMESPLTASQMQVLFSFIHEHDIGELITVKNAEGITIGGSIILYDARYGHNWLNSTLEECQKSGGNLLLYREVIERIRELGIATFDMRMGNIERLNAFAQNFTPDRVPYYRLIRPLPVPDLDASVDIVDNFLDSLMKPTVPHRSAVGLGVVNLPRRCQKPFSIRSRSRYSTGL